MRSNLHSKFGRDVEMRVISFLRLPNRFGNLWQGEEFCKIHGASGKAVLTVRGFRARRSRKRFDGMVWMAE